MTAHEFIEVGDRRWCVGCDLFQQRQKGAVYFPTPRNGCERSTPYAKRKDAPLIKNEGEAAT